VKRLKKTNPVEKGGKTVEALDFEEDEAEKLELVKRHMGLKKNKDVIKALILEKFDEIKLEEKNLTKQRIAEEKAMEYSENFTCPLFK
jgi:long-subunit acyl-CoA synthetase (AMP-forming)